MIEINKYCSLLKDSGTNLFANYCCLCAYYSKAQLEKVKHYVLLMSRLNVERD